MGLAVLPASAPPADEGVERESEEGALPTL